MSEIRRSDLMSEQLHDQKTINIHQTVAKSDNQEAQNLIKTFHDRNLGDFQVCVVLVTRWKLFRTSS